MRLLVLLLLLAVSSVSAQVITAEADLDTNAILIGQQTLFNIRIVHPVAVPVKAPDIGDTITGKIEVIGRPVVDTVYSRDSSSVTETYKYTITSFDSGFFPVPPIRIYSTADSGLNSETPALLLQVTALDVDTAQGFKDIKPPLDVPYTIKEFIPYMLGALILGIVIWIIFRMLRKKKSVVPLPPIPSRPPHEIALEAIDELDKLKLWQEGKYKEFHIRLTDIIRDYLADAFNIHAQEYTSAEILASTRNSINEDAQLKLRQILVIADLVKFAKEIPVAYENELSIRNAREFVLLTTRPERKEVEIEGR